jgi:transcriptional regulator with XRE-family HTH domain
MRMSSTEDQPAWAEGAERDWADDAADPESVLGQRVRDLRLGLGVSQAELGEALAKYGFPMHQTTVAKLEAADRPIRVNEAAALARIFKVPLAQLMAFKEVERPRLAELRRHMEEASAAARRAEQDASAARDQVAVAEARRARAEQFLAATRAQYEEEVSHLERGEAT